MRDGKVEQAFLVQQKPLGVASFPCGDLKLHMSSNVRYHFKLGTRNQSTGLETAVFRLATFTDIQKP